MIWKHIFSTFRSKHFNRREPNDANTVSIFNFVALKNPMIFFKFSKLLYTVVGLLIKICWNVDRVYIFCAPHMSIKNLLNYICLGISEIEAELIDVLVRKFVVALVACCRVSILRFTGLENSPHQQSFRN